MPPNLPARILERAAGALSIACGWWLVALAVLTAVEIVGRKLFGFSLQGVDELGGYTLAVVSAIGFSYALVTRGHTRIDFLVSRLAPGPRAVFNWAAAVTLAALAVFAAGRGYTVLAESIEFQSTATTPLQTPLWIPQSLWFLGWALFAVIAGFGAAHASLLLLRDRTALNRIYGPQTLAEEIESEAGEVLREARGETPR